MDFQNEIFKKHWILLIVICADLGNVDNVWDWHRRGQ